MGQAPAFGGTGAGCGDSRRRDAGKTIVQRRCESEAKRRVPVGWGHLSQRVVGSAASDPQADTAAAVLQNHVPVAFEQCLGRDRIAVREVGEPHRGEAGGRRLRDGDERAGLRPP